MLAASRGSAIDVEATGDDAEAMLDAIGELIANRFNEAE
jgi:phosphocarrier protein